MPPGHTAQACLAISLQGKYLSWAGPSWGLAGSQPLVRTCEHMHPVLTASWVLLVLLHLLQSPRLGPRVFSPSSAGQFLFTVRGPPQMFPMLGSHLAAPSGQSFPALGSPRLASHSGLACVSGCGLEAFKNPPSPQSQAPQAQACAMASPCSRRGSVLFRVCFLFTRSFIPTFIHSTKPNPDPSWVPPTSSPDPSPMFQPGEAYMGGW